MSTVMTDVNPTQEDASSRDRLFSLSPIADGPNEHAVDPTLDQQIQSQALAPPPEPIDAAIWGIITSDRHSQLDSSGLESIHVSPIQASIDSHKPINEVIDSVNPSEIFHIEIESKSPDEGPPSPTSEHDSSKGKSHSHKGSDASSTKMETPAIPAPVPKKKKKSHARKQPAGHIPRPRNAFILFRKHITDNNLIPTTVEVKHQNISIVASKMWAEAPPEVKAEFTEAARIEKEEHGRLYPNYRYQPAYRRTDIVRRRVRKDENEDEKCDAVANLLIQGKAGEVLEVEIKEQIASVTPGIDDPKKVKLAVKKGRRRRKDTPGELSKGAIRAQKAKARARAMRESWVESGFLIADADGQQLRNRFDMQNQRLTRSAFAEQNQEYMQEQQQMVMMEDGTVVPMQVRQQFPPYMEEGFEMGGFDPMDPFSGQNSPIDMPPMDQLGMPYPDYGGMEPPIPMNAPQDQAFSHGPDPTQPSSPNDFYQGDQYPHRGARAPGYQFRTQEGLPPGPSNYEAYHEIPYDQPMNFQYHGGNVLAEGGQVMEPISQADMDPMLRPGSFAYGEQQPQYEADRPQYHTEQAQYNSDWAPSNVEQQPHFYEQRHMESGDQQLQPVNQGGFAHPFPVDYAPIARPADIVTDQWLRESIDPTGPIDQAPDQIMPLNIEAAANDVVAPEELSAMIPFMEPGPGEDLAANPTHGLDFGDNLFGGELFQQKDVDLHAYEEALRHGQDFGAARQRLSH